MDCIKRETTMSKSIKLTIDGKEYTVALKDDILNMLPLELTLQRYAGHEYYCSLPQKPSIKGVPMTSDAHAGGIYYYDGWSAFTVLYGGADITPFEVVHIGDVNEDIITPLAAAENTVQVKLEIK